MRRLFAWLLTWPVRHGHPRHARRRRTKTPTVFQQFRPQLDALENRDMPGSVVSPLALLFGQGINEPISAMVSRWRYRAFQLSLF